MTEFALLGRHPACGCPMALDMTASGNAQAEFLEKGLLLEFLSPAAAESAWSAAVWPCPHSASRPPDHAAHAPPSPMGDGVLALPVLRLLD